MAAERRSRRITTQRFYGRLSLDDLLALLLGIVALAFSVASIFIGLRPTVTFELFAIFGLILYLVRERAI